MSLDKIGLDPDMNGHEFKWRMWEWETPSFPLYYQFDENTRKQKKDKIEEIYAKAVGRLR